MRLSGLAMISIESDMARRLDRGDYSQGMPICDSPLVSVIGLL